MEIRINKLKMIYNYELIVEELRENGIEIAEDKVALKYAEGYHRLEKRVFGHIRVKPLFEIKKIMNFPVGITKKSVLGDVEKILTPKVGLPHMKQKGALFYWIPFQFNGDSPGIEIITIRE